MSENYWKDGIGLFVIQQFVTDVIQSLDAPKYFSKVL